MGKFEVSLQSGNHKFLNSLCGNWSGKVKTWFEPNKLADTSPIEGEIHPILDGMFVLHRYSGSLQGKPMTGMATIGYSLAEREFQVSWVNSFHNGTRIMLSVGAADDVVEKFSVKGSYPAGEGPDWGWRTEFHLRSADNLVISHYNIMPEGQEDLAVEIDYRRQG